MSLFTWASAFQTSNIQWRGASWSPAQVVTGFYTSTTPTAQVARSGAVRFQPGERIRTTVRYRNPSGSLAGVRVLLDDLTSADSWAPILQENLPLSEEEQVISVSHVWRQGEAQVRPIVTFYGDAAFTITRVEVDRVPSIDQYVRSYDADGGSDAYLYAISEPGDLAILAVASQYGDTAATAPEGWTEVHTPSASARSGYVATRVVSDPSETLSLAPRLGDQSAARKRSMLIVLKGVPGEPEIQGWQTDPFTLGEGYAQVLLSQRHSVANAPSGDWEPQGGTLLTAGEASSTASWSRLAAAYTTAAHGMPENESPQMWARVLLRAPAKGARVYVLREGGREVPASLRPMPPGASSVSDLLATPGFWVAHRGGSYSWPESSMLAYTQSVSRGAPALEASAHRTTDGVWFLSHDVNLSRVDPSAPATDVRDMTWDEVSRYTTMGRPLVLLEELVDAYASSHVIFLDPKNSALNWQESVSGLDKSRTVLKFSADATWLARQWKADGWTTWGYMYETQVASGQARQWFDTGVWDLIGMEYTASQETWTEVTSWGVPVLGHIAPDAAAYRAALDKGAAGVMLAGVADLVKEGV